MSDDPVLVQDVRAHRSGCLEQDYHVLFFLVKYLDIIVGALSPHASLFVNENGFRVIVDAETNVAVKIATELGQFQP